MLAQPKTQVMIHEPSWSHVFSMLGDFESIDVDSKLFDLKAFKVPKVSLFNAKQPNSALTIVTSTSKSEINELKNTLKTHQQLWVMPLGHKLSLGQLIWLKKSCDKAFNISPSIDKPLHLMSYSYGPHYMARMQYQHQLPKWLISLKVYAHLWWAPPTFFVYQGLR